MPLILLLSVAIQIGCAVHVVRTGRPYFWLFIILFFSLIGCAVYLITQVVPELGNNRGLRKAADKARRTLDPERERRRIQSQLQLADTLQNRLALAHESAAMGDSANAAELFQSCLRGMYENDSGIMLELAQAQFASNDFVATRTTLEALIAANPKFRSAIGHLLYARTLEALGDTEAALKEYAALDTSYPGEEARVRHALLLKQIGREAEARQVWQQVLLRSQASPKFYQRNEKNWIEQAKRELA